MRVDPEPICEFYLHGACCDRQITLGHQRLLPGTVVCPKERQIQHPLHEPTVPPIESRAVGLSR